MTTSGDDVTGTFAAVSTEEVWEQYVATRDGALRERLIVQYAPLVKYVVGRLAINLPAILDSEDIISYGVIGLIDAIERFDPKRGLKFETYAIPRVRGSIIDSLRSLDQVPRSIRQKAREIERTFVELEQELGRPPTEDETASRLGVSVEKFQQVCIRAGVVNISLEHLLENDEDSNRSPIEAIADPTVVDPLETIERWEQVRHLAVAIRRLPKNERLVLSLYYHEELTMREIAQVMEISEPRVSQLHAQAIFRLRGLLRNGPAHGQAEA